MACMTVTGIPTSVLVATDGLPGSFGAGEVAAAICRGLAAVGQPAEAFPVVVADGGSLAEALSGYDERMRAARAVVAAAGVLSRESLTGTVISEVATRARQAGVPCHAVVAANRLEPFDQRILDLQLILEASTLPEIELSGCRIGQRLRDEHDRGR